MSDILPASHWQQTELEQYDDNDADSTLGSSATSTTSLSASIFEYREILGRTFHHELGSAEAWSPNDEKHAESMDLYHYLHLLMYDNKLHMAPLSKNIQKALDVGTGTGIWACEFGDEYPSCEVTGTDVSPMQPPFVPPNVQFLVDNAEDEWTWPDNTFDYIHFRALMGSIKDWDRLYKQAYRCLKPGGWIEHHDNVVQWTSDANPIPEESACGQYHKVIWKAGELMGQTFKILEDDIPGNGMTRAGFINMNTRDFKAYYGNWPTERKAKAIGQCSKLTLEQDPEGWVLYLWNFVLGWSHDEIRVYLAHVLRQLNNPQTQAYINHKVWWAQKPVGEECGEDVQETIGPAPKKKSMMPVTTDKVVQGATVESGAQIESH